MKLAYKIRGNGSPPSKNVSGPSFIEDKYISKNYIERESKVGKVVVQFGVPSQPKQSHRELFSKPNSPSYLNKNKEIFSTSGRIIFKQRSWKNEDPTKSEEKPENSSDSLKFKLNDPNSAGGSPKLPGSRNINTREPFVESDPYKIGRAQKAIKFPRIDSDSLNSYKSNDSSPHIRNQELGSRGLVVSRSANLKNLGVKQQADGEGTFSGANNLKKQFSLKGESADKMTVFRSPKPLSENKNQIYGIPAVAAKAQGPTSKAYQRQASADSAKSESDSEKETHIPVEKDKKKRLSDIGMEGRSLPESIQKYLEIQVEPRESELKISERISNADKGDVKSNEKEEKVIECMSFKSKAGCNVGNVTKTNQDSFIVNNNFAGSKNKSFFAVCDGHGTNGHHVSGFIKNNLTKNIFREQRGSDSPSQIKKALVEGYFNTHRQLLESKIECSFSGTTAVSLFLINRKIYCANIGDSRAIMASSKKGAWSVKALTDDQKPDNPSEKERIINAGGRVEQYIDASGEKLGPFRVWLKDENIPGLAMSRSIGDMVASQVGVIAEPVITEYEITSDDKFIIIASDGVWEFLSNTQVMNLVIPYFFKKDPESAAERLIRESVILWKKEDDVIDDITCIVIFLNQ